MKEIVEIQNAIRANLIAILESYSLPQLALIPKGYSNNIFWNIAHVTATQQLLCYFLGNIPMKIDKFWIDNFKKGTSPNLKIEKEHISELIQLLKNQPLDFLHDYDNNRFETYQNYPTSMGITLKSIEDACRYNLFHEGLHLGYVMAMKKIV